MTALRWLEHPRAMRVVFAIAILVALPSLALGFFSDDHAFFAWLDHPERFGHGPWDLYRFTGGTRAENLALVADGRLPWWSAPDLRVHFLRPLSSALLAMDHALYGEHALGSHVESLVWWAALVAAVGAIHARALSRSTATLAFLVFAVSAANVQPFAWLSARHAVVAAAPALAGLVALMRAREDGWRPGRWLAPLAIAVGLLGGETALGVAAFAIAYDLVGPVPGTLRERATRALPVAGVAAAYVVAYGALGLGARSCDGYVSPFTPGPFLEACAIRVPMYLANAFLGTPAELAVMGLAPALAIAGAVATIGILLLWRACAPFVSQRDRASVRWLALGAVLSLFVAIGGFPGARTLLVPNLGFAAILGILLRYGFAHGAHRVARGVGASLVLLFDVVLATLGGQTSLHSLDTFDRATIEAAHDSKREIAGAPHVLIASGSDPMGTIYAAAVIVEEGAPATGCWSWLSGAKADVRVTRVDRTTLAIEPIGATLLRAPFETLFRAQSIPSHVGDEAEQCGAHIRVAAVEGGFPTRVEARMDDLDAPDVAIVAWKEGALRRLDVSKIGASVVVPWTVGPTKFF